MLPPCNHQIPLLIPCSVTLESSRPSLGSHKTSTRPCKGLDRICPMAHKLKLNAGSLLTKSSSGSLWLRVCTAQPTDGRHLLIGMSMLAVEPKRLHRRSWLDMSPAPFPNPGRRLRQATSRAIDEAETQKRQRKLRSPSSCTTSTCSLPIAGCGGPAETRYASL